MEDDILNETVSSEDLKKFERAYHTELTEARVTRETQFNYAWCLVRSRYSADIRKGIMLLEELFKTEESGDDSAKRDYLYYLAMGNARIKEYSTALQYTRSFLQVEPGNQQVATLEALIKKKMEIEGLKGMALAGGVAIAIGGILGLGFALAKGKR
ncbi:mitochondrial fission 1 protein-like [Planococcus citri]|uniref:mitochondrial fission 1 protein-like n=1 Tax=Planococcus citri TaxID=170843 RepID=UPI0031F77008